VARSSFVNCLAWRRPKDRVPAWPSAAALASRSRWSCGKPASWLFGDRSASRCGLQCPRRFWHHLGHRPSPNKIRPRPRASVSKALIVATKMPSPEPEPRETDIQAQRTAAAITRSGSVLTLPLTAWNRRAAVYPHPSKPAAGRECGRRGKHLGSELPPPRTPGAFSLCAKGKPAVGI